MVNFQIWCVTLCVFSRTVTKQFTTRFCSSHSTVFAQLQSVQIFQKTFLGLKKLCMSHNSICFNFWRPSFGVQGAQIRKKTTTNPCANLPNFCVFISSPSFVMRLSFWRLLHLLYFKLHNCKCKLFSYHWLCYWWYNINLNEINN